MADYEFVTETIKKRPVNKRKLIKKIMFTVFMAVVFGAVASVTFLFVYPKLNERLYPIDDTKQVVLPVDAEEPVVDETIEEFVPPETEDESVISEEVKEEPEEVQASVEDESGKDVVINQVVETVEKDLEIDDYKSLMRKISTIADAAEKSIVTVSSKSTDTDWFNNAYESNNSTTGFIVADNGKELIVIAPSDFLQDVSYADVTFCNGNTYSAQVRCMDYNTGLCAVTVQLSSLSDETKDGIEYAQFGSLTSSSVGTPVIAVGAPYGYAGSTGYGQITSNTNVIEKIDSNVRMISTDIYASSAASGILVNYSGRVVGIICHESIFDDMPNLIHAYMISDISSIIEKISNNDKVACLGVIGVDVTRQANEEYDVPLGVYVKEVVVDSPAMNIGVRNGDVITKFDGVMIRSLADYKTNLLKYTPSDIVSVTLLRPIEDEYTEITYMVTLEEMK